MTLHRRGTMSSVRVVERFEDVEPLVGEWEALLEDAECAEPVITPQWFQAWWSVFGDGARELRFVTVRDGTELIALAPFARRTFWYRAGLPFRRLELVPSGEARNEEVCSEYIGMIVKRGQGARVAKAIAQALVTEKLGSWDELMMPALNSEDPFVEQVSLALRDLGCRVDVSESGRCPFITLPGTWEEYLARLPKKHRYGVRRTLKDFHDWVGKRPWSLARVESEADLKRGFEILTSLHGERWRGEGAFQSSRFSRFHAQIMGELAAERGGSLELLWLEVEGTPIAVAYNIIYRGKVYFYQSGRSLELPKSVRAGVVMQLMAIRRAIEEGRSEYDFLGGASVYKRQLALDSRALVTLRAIAPTRRARVVEVVRTTVSRMARLAR